MNFSASMPPANVPTFRAWWFPEGPYKSYTIYTLSDGDETPGELPRAAGRHGVRPKQGGMP